MYALNRLSHTKKYLISNHPGEWHFSRVVGDFATFYKFARNNTRVSIKLSLSRVEEMVWEQVSLTQSRVSLTFNLESFQGE